MSGTERVTDRATVRRLLASHGLASVAMSLPWPLLLALVWEATHDATLLGLAAAARLLPYVACSWWVGRLADRHRRDVLVRVTLWLRLALLAGTAAGAAAGHLALAVVLAALAVAVATPAYPAQAAGLPGLAALAGADARRATNLLVTLEVSSFVVGPAIGGLLLVSPAAVWGATLAGTAAALVLLRGVRMPLPRRVGTAGAASPYAVLRGHRGLVPAIAMMATLNLVLAGAGIALLPLADTGWAGTWGPATAYGVATAALGFGAVGGPLLARLGRGDAGRARAGLLLGAAALAVVAIAPTVSGALLPLVVVGAAAVHAESAATSLIQDRAPDDVRAGILGVADAAMIGAALLGSLLAPALLAVLGGPLLLGVLAGVVLLAERLVPGHRPTHRADGPTATTASHEDARATRDAVAA